MKKVILSAINLFAGVWIFAYLSHLMTPNPNTWVQGGALATSIFLVVICVWIEIVIVDG
jgi:hypothetical protein